MTGRNETTADFAGQELNRIADLLMDRNGTHGDATAQHGIMAQLWRMYLFIQTPEGLRVRDIGPKDAMFLMLLMKVSRVMASGLDRQHVEDIVGYSALILGAAEKAAAIGRGDMEGPETQVSSVPETIQ